MMLRRRRSKIDARIRRRHLLAAALALVATASGCENQPPAPLPIDSKTELKLHDLLNVPVAEDARNGLERVQSLLGKGTVVEPKQFEQKTGYKLKQPSKVECRIWDAPNGKWIAIAFDRKTQNPLAYKSNVEP